MQNQWHISDVVIAFRCTLANDQIIDCYDLCEQTITHYEIYAYIPNDLAKRAIKGINKQARKQLFYMSEISRVVDLPFDLHSWICCAPSHMAPSHANGC